MEGENSLRILLDGFKETRHFHVFVSASFPLSLSLRVSIHMTEIFKEFRILKLTNAGIV